MGYQLASPWWAYAYVQYADDDNILALFQSANFQNQQYVDFFSTYNLAVYTDDAISGPLLDWTAEGIYGMTRPIFPVGITNVQGSYGTSPYGILPYGFFTESGSSTFYVVNDDIFKRCMTWNFYKGDGTTFNVTWLKRRVIRFLMGANGQDVGIDNTYGVSVTNGVGNLVNITLSTALAALPEAPVLEAAINAGILQTPFQYSFAVIL